MNKTQNHFLLTLDLQLRGKYFVVCVQNLTIIRMCELSDEALLDLVKTGDKSAFSALVLRYQPLLFMVACQKLQCEEEARDAVQEVFTWLWLKRESVEVQSSLRNYLCGAVRNYCLNVVRSQKNSRKRKRQYAYIREIFATPAELENKELNLRLRHAINNIAPASRAVFEMQYLEGFSQKEIAARRGIGLQTVKNQVLTALKELRHSLKNI
jgi:RNA polymerase sigma-70 factor (ECF subfamily)